MANNIGLINIGLISNYNNIIYLTSKYRPTPSNVKIKIPIESPIVLILNVSTSGKPLFFKVIPQYIEIINSDRRIKILASIHHFLRLFIDWIKMNGKRIVNAIKAEGILE